MANSQNPNQLPPPQHKHRRFTAGEITLHTLVIIVLMISTGYAFKMSNSFGAFAAAISICIVVFMNNKVNIRITNQIAKFGARKIDDFYNMLAHTSPGTRFATLFMALRICLLSLVIIKLFFIFFSRPSVVSYCDFTAGLVSKYTSATNDLSLGCTVFYIQRTDGSLKTQAAAFFKQGHIQEGIATLRAAYKKDSSDPEIPIYIADQLILSSHVPFFTIVVGTILTGRYAYMGYDGLQGDAVAQQEYNANTTHTVKELVIVANFGSDQTQSTAKTIANEIANAAKQNHSVVGMIGPPFCFQTRAAVDALQAAGIPVISPDASCDDLKGYSKYLFLLAPFNSIQAKEAAAYAEKMHFKTIAIFTNKADTENSYDQATDFKQQFHGQTFEEPYVPGSIQKIIDGAHDALQSKPRPDALFFTGYPDDLNALLPVLPVTGAFAQLPVIGLNSLYELGGYNTDMRTRMGFAHLKIISLFYPDESAILSPMLPKASFFGDYAAMFDSGNYHNDWPYGYNRMDSEVALSYDSMNVLLNALLGTPISRENAVAGLKNTADHSSWQGITGQINFADNNAPINKAIVLLWIDNNKDDIHMGGLIGGCFLKAQCLTDTQGTSNITPGKGAIITYFMHYCMNIITSANDTKLAHRCSSA